MKILIMTYRMVILAMTLGQLDDDVLSTIQFKQLS